MSFEEHLNKPFVFRYEEKGEYNDCLCVENDICHVLIELEFI